MHKIRYLFRKTLVRNIAGTLQNVPKMKTFSVKGSKICEISCIKSSGNSEIIFISGNKIITNIAKIMYPREIAIPPEITLERNCEIEYFSFVVRKI